jgi:hypothetical protein
LSVAAFYPSFIQPPLAVFCGLAVFSLGGIPDPFATTFEKKPFAMVF